MKKLFAMLLVLAMLLTLAACGEKEKETKEDNILKIGKYEAVYTGSEIVKNSNDEDVIVINFDFTNNSDEAKSFEWAYYYNVFQEGIGLSYAAIFVSEDSYDTLDESMRTDVQPGKTIPVSMTYKLNSLTAPVEIEVTDLLDEEKDTLTIDPATAVRKDNASVDTTEEPETDAPETEAPETGELDTEANNGEITADWWLGDWYGTWSVVNGTGEYEDIAGGTWDCCAYINATEDGNYYLSIWDEDYNDYDNNCLAETELEFKTEFAFGERGAMQTTDYEGNYFWTGSLDSSSWYIDPDMLSYKDTFTVYADLTDENGDTCEYMITLCKFGCEWDETAGAYPEYYESYFLPLMNEGVALPAVFEPNK